LRGENHETRLHRPRQAQRQQREYPLWEKAPDVCDILPTVRARGVIVPLLVRPNCVPDQFAIVAGARRLHAAKIVADERQAAGIEFNPLPCAILNEGDDVSAVEA
jgi:ParB family chromosome partitioning protein